MQNSLQEFEDILNYESDDYHHIYNWIVAQVDYLLHHNMERLQWVLYRIDIDENVLKRTLLSNEEKPVAECIADLIVKRQIEKYKSRQKNNNTNDWSFDI